MLFWTPHANFQVVENDIHGPSARIIKNPLNSTINILEVSDPISLWDLESRITTGNWCSMSHLTLLVRRHGPWYPVDWWRSWNDRVARVPTSQTSPRAKLVSGRVDVIGLLDNRTQERGRDRSQSLCVLRRSGSELGTRWTRATWRTPLPPPSNSLLVGEVCRWITNLAGSSSPGELSAGRTGPMINALS